MYFSNYKRNINTLKKICKIQESRIEHYYNPTTQTATVNILYVKLVPNFKIPVIQLCSDIMQ